VVNYAYYHATVTTPGIEFWQAGISQPATISGVIGNDGAPAITMQAVGGAFVTVENDLVLFSNGELNLIKSGPGDPVIHSNVDYFALHGDQSSGLFAVGGGAPPNNYILFVSEYGGPNIEAIALLFYSTSSTKLKRDIVSIPDYHIDALHKLRPVNFQWKHKDGQHIGLIAEEVQELFPHLVHDIQRPGVEGTDLAISYTELIPVLISAVQDLKKQVDQIQGAH
jgi:hypothetical protein